MHENVKKCLSQMTERDFQALKSIYDYRCLSEQQIYEINYKTSEHLKKPVGDAYFRTRKFKKWIEWGLIEEGWSYDRNLPPVYFLTTLGVSVIRRAFKFPNNIYDGKKISVRGYQTAYELKVEEKFIPHQYNLNRFAIELAKISEENGCEYEYEDERHTSKYTYIRPDGVFYTEACDVFLEMDMGTETEFQLCEKWNHYRAFKSSEEFFNKNKPIKIFFICDNVKNINKRIKLIKKSISTHFIDIIDNNFDIYVGTHESLIKAFKNSVLRENITGIKENMELGAILKNQFGLSIGKSEKYEEILDSKYMFFGKKNDFMFAIDDVSGDALSLINRIHKFNLMSPTFENELNCNIKYILKVDSVYLSAENIDLFNIIFNGNILFTTDELLKKASNFPEALISFIGPNMTSGQFVDMNFKTYKRVVLDKNI